MIHRQLAHDRNRKIEISTAPTKAKSGKPAYLQALIQNKIDRPAAGQIQIVRQAGIQSDG